MNEEIVKELKDIRNLLILLLTKSKATNVEISNVLDLDQSRITQILSKKKKVQK